MDQYLELYIILPVRRSFTCLPDGPVAMLTATTASHCVTDWTWNGLHKMQLCLTQFCFKLQDGSLCRPWTPSTPLLTCFFFILPPPPPPPSHPGLPFSFTSRPIFLFLPLFLPFLQDGQGSSQNTIWNSETSHSAAGLLHINYSSTTQTVKVLHILRIRPVLQYKRNYNIFGNYFICSRKLLAGLQQSNQATRDTRTWHLRLDQNQKPEPVSQSDSVERTRPGQKRPVEISKGHWKSLMGLLTIGESSLSYLFYWKCWVTGTKLGHI